MKRLTHSIMYGFCLTMAFYAADLTVMRYFPWTDKPMMPNFFTFLLTPGFEAAMSFHLNHWPLTVVAMIFDSLLFAFPVWLLLLAKADLAAWKKARPR